MKKVLTLSLMAILTIGLFSFTTVEETKEVSTEKTERVFSDQEVADIMYKIFNYNKVSTCTACSVGGVNVVGNNGSYMLWGWVYDPEFRSYDYEPLPNTPSLNSVQAIAWCAVRLAIIAPCAFD